MTRRLSDLWNGRVPLARVFWDWAVIYGSFANLLATGAALTMIVLGWPALLAVAVHFLPVPYNLLMVVAVWRSAARYAGRRDLGATRPRRHPRLGRDRDAGLATVIHSG